MSDQPPGVDRDFILQFPVRDRGPAAEAFHRAVRAGASTSTEVVAAVRRQALDDLPPSSYPDPVKSDRARALLRGLEDDPAGARELAQHAIAWNALPLEERNRLKADRRAEHARAHLAQYPPTEKQLDYLRALGCDETPANRLVASLKIDELRDQQRREVKR